MGRTSKDLSYLKNIEPIKKYLRDTPLDPKKVKNSLLATDRIFPYLVNRFKENIEELKNFDLQTFLTKSTIEINEITQEWNKTNINNTIFDAWKKETPETRSNILMKWVKFCLKQEGLKPKTEKRTKENSFLSYMWTFQGLLAYLGRDYEANPKKLDQLKQNDIKLGSEINYNEVVELYDKLNEKYKLILRIMMYSGLNPIDILKLTPRNFQKVNSSIKKKLNDKRNDFYYVIKERTKTERKNVLFLLVFAESFFNELKSYFERTITINIKKQFKTKINDKNRKDINVLKEQISKNKKNGKSNDLEREKLNEIYQKLHINLDINSKNKINSIKNERYIKDKKEINRYEIIYESENTIRFEGQYYWNYDSNISIFRTINNTTTVADNFKYMVDKHGLNKFLKPYQIRSLCFTMLKDQFTFKDENLYQLWTQHRVKGLVDRNYITNNLQILINKYLPKIEATVLIGSLKDTLEKAIEYKEKAEAINDNTDKITELEQDKQRLLNKLNDNEKKIEDLTTEMNNMWEYIKRGEKLAEDKKKLDEYKIP